MKTSFWFSVIMTALVVGLGSWFGAKGYYTKPTTWVDTVSVDIGWDSAAPTSTYGANTVWIVDTIRSVVTDTVEVGVHDTVVVPTYPALDTVMVATATLAPVGQAQVEVPVRSRIFVGYNSNLNQFALRQTFFPIRVDLPVKVSHSVVTVREPQLLWAEVNAAIQGSRPGLGAKVGILSYSVGGRFILGADPVWEVGYRFGI